MMYNFFLYYGWFVQNLRKDFIRTNMHTTIPACSIIHQHNSQLCWFPKKALNNFFTPLYILDEAGRTEEYICSLKTFCKKPKHWRIYKALLVPTLLLITFDFLHVLNALRQWIIGLFLNIGIFYTSFYKYRLIPKICEWAKYQNRHSSKSIWVMNLFFCQNYCPIRWEFWQKNRFITHILFELCLFWYLAHSQILGNSL